MPPDLTGIARARAELHQKEADRRDIERQLAELLTSRTDLLGRGGTGLDLRHLDARIEETVRQREQIDRARDELTRTVHGLSGGLFTARGPAELIASLDGRVPVALLPVRVETRFDDNATALKVRIYPDHVQLDGHDPALTDDEVQAGHWYWTERWPAPGDEALAGRIWTALVRRLAPGRARHVVDATRPVNLPASAPPAEGETPDFPDTPLRPPGYSRPPRATVLPERFLVAGYRRNAEGQYTELFRQWGEHTVPDTLATAPSPGMTAPEQPDGAPPDPHLKDRLPEDPGLKWVHDPQAAEEAGVLVTVRERDHPGLRLSQGVDRLFVLGVDWTKTPDESAKDLQTLLVSHQDDGSLAFVAQGTPTNNTSGSRSGWTSAIADATAQLAPHRAVGALDEWSAARRLTRALGVAHDSLDRTPGAELREHRWHSGLHDALWQATAGYYLWHMLDPLVDKQTIADLREFCSRHLFACGPLPMFRVGPQPYGVLPVVARKAYQARGGSRAEKTLHRVADTLRTLVAPQVDKVPHLRRAGSPQHVDDALAALLQRTPVPWTLKFREAIGPAQLKAMSVDWERLAAFQQSMTAAVWARFGADRLTRLAELTLDSGDAHPLRVPLVHKDEGGLGYLTEIAALLSDRDGRLELNVGELNLREDSRTLLEALAACAGVWEIDAVGEKLTGKYREFVTGGAPTGEVLARTPDMVRVEETGGAQLPFTYATNRQLANAVIPAIDPVLPLAEVVTTGLGAHLKAGTISALLGAPTDPRYWLARRHEALSVLATAPEQQLEWAFRGYLDLFSTRLDAWWTSLATARLEHHRTAAPTGVHAGCWGWVEDLRPDTGPAAESLGHVHTPSLAHAVTAALLRNARLVHQDAQGARFDIELTSTRTREALALLDGVARGQRLTALLGYRIERRLRDLRPELAAYILPLRTHWPLAPSESAPSPQPAETVAPRDVVDAVTLLDSWRTDSEGVLTTAGVATPHRAEVKTVIDTVAGLYDAVSDVLVAEAVHQTAQGNLERGGAALAAHDRHIAAPDPDFVRTPRSGHAVSHRVGLLLQDTAPAPGWPRDVRAAVEPRLDSWLGGVLGDPARLHVQARLVRADNTQQDLAPVPVSALGLGPLSLVVAAARPSDDRPSELEARLVKEFTAQVGGAGPDDRIELSEGTTGQPDTDGALGLLRTLAAWATEVLGARPLIADDFGSGDDLVADAGPVATVDTAELAARADSAVAALDTAVAVLQTAAGPQELATALDGCTVFDAPDALAQLHPAHPDAAAVLTAQATDVLARLRVRRQAATDLLAQPAAPDADARVEQLRGIVTAVLGKGQPLLPLLHLTTPARIEASLADRAALTGGDSTAPATWLHRYALVRPRLDPLAGLLTHAEAGGADVAQELQIIQQPHRPGAPWIALPFGRSGPPPAGTIALACHAPGPLAPSAPVAGLLVDQWTETVPAARDTTAVSFHYDAPGARPPQSLLLAVHPYATPTGWSLDLLLDSVHEASDLARLRTLSARELAPLLDGFLPALYLPSNYTHDVPSLSPWKLKQEAAVDVKLSHVLGKG